MLNLIQGVITRPTETFRDLTRQATVRQAAMIVLIVALLVVAPMFVLISGFTVQVSMAATKLLFYFLIWGAVGWISGLIATRVAKGAGTARSSLVIAGFAAVPLGLNFLIGLVLSIANVSTPMLQLVSVLMLGWAILLLYIGTREIHDLSGGAVAACVAPAILAGLVLSMAQNRLENYIICFSPAPELAVVGWDELPEGYEQVLKNPAFDQEGEPGSDASEIAPGWSVRRPSPFAFLARPGWELDRAEARSGRHAARLFLEGVPQADANVSVLQETHRPPVGEPVHLSVWMKSEDAVVGAARVLFLSDDPQAPVVGGMTTTLLEGTNPWAEYRVKGVVPEGARRITVEVLLAGHGTLWADDCRLYLPPQPTEEDLAREEGRPPATIENAPERIVEQVRANAPEGLMDGRPTIFVAPIGDRTAERADTANLRQRIEELLAAEQAAIPVDRRSERQAGLNEIGFFGGRFVSRSEATDRARQAGAQVVFFPELAPGDSPAHNLLTVWIMDVAQGEIVAKAEVPVGIEGE